ncbi:MAG: GNAT family N-acetyltransferase [Verrucomicrobiota bacterium]|nr:GNAT family N-acetyltransferase [Verrucomicrobiota bacterium]
MHLIPIPRDGSVSLSGITLPEAATSVVAATVQLYARRGYVEPWVGYLAIEGGKCVGGCGFAAPPTEDIVEIAYFTFPDFERPGMATRMVQGLISIAQECDPSVKIIAHTLAEENASNHILRKLGFAFTDTIDHPEDGKIWKWSYEPKFNRA